MRPATRTVMLDCRLKVVAMSPERLLPERSRCMQPSMRYAWHTCGSCLFARLKMLLVVKQKYLHAPSTRKLVIYAWPRSYR